MGRRSRQRIATSAPAAPREQPAPLPTAARSRRDEAPAAPWGRFPLVELSALAAIMLGVAGFVIAGRSGAVLLTAAALLGSVAGLEVAIREHLGGYRSHTLVLAGLMAVVTITALALLRTDRTVMLAGGGGMLLVGIAGWRALFKRRSGGFGFRVH